MELDMGPIVDHFSRKITLIQEGRPYKHRGRSYTEPSTKVTIKATIVPVGSKIIVRSQGLYREGDLIAIFSTKRLTKLKIEIHETRDRILWMNREYKIASLVEYNEISNFVKYRCELIVPQEDEISEMDFKSLIGFVTVIPTTSLDASVNVTAP